jgi:hypothetical protein
MMKSILRPILAASVLTVSACGGGGGGGSVPPVTPVGTGTTGTIALSPPSLAFTSTGSASAAQSTASEKNYSGSFQVTNSTCSGIATAAQSGAVFTITPVGAGSCSMTIGDSLGNAATLAIGVTLSSIGVQTSPRTFERPSWK